MKLRLFIFLLPLFLSLGACKDRNAHYDRKALTLIPQPKVIEMAGRPFTIDEKTTLLVPPGDTQARQVAEVFQEYLKKGNGLELAIDEASDVDRSNGIFFIYEPGFKNKEGYKLAVEKGKIVIRGASSAGLFYGTQTLRQLLPDSLENGNFGEKTLTVPPVRIFDEPRFKWRGMHMDVSRHFYTVDYVKQFMDYMGLYKFNTLHLHLTDDQGWRLEIKAYPKLTEEGAWRSFNRHDRECVKKSKTDPSYTINPDLIHKDEKGKTIYGGFYTQEDIKELIAYGAARNISIVPEIDVPGHFMAAINSYPELCCTGRPGWGRVFSKPICPGKESTYEFVETILDEVCALFPSPYIHIGGDEVNKEEWKRCPNCQKVIKEEGLANEHELQSFFLKRIEKFLVNRGKRMIGWDEVLEGGIEPSTTVMFWRGWAPENPGVAAKGGNEVIMTPTSHCYFDYQQSAGTLENVYSFEPVPEGFTPEMAPKIIGAQGNLWSEYIPSNDRMDYMALPRMIALAEVAWVNPEQKNWEDFQRRMIPHYERLDQMGVYYRQPDISGFHPFNVFVDEKKVSLTIPLKGMNVHYTRDGSLPTAESPKYTEPFVITESDTLQFRVIRDNGKMGEIMTAIYEKQPLLEPVEVTDQETGVSYHHYAGRFTAIKDIGRGKWKSNGIQPSFTIPENVTGERFGLIFSGFVKVPQDGIYTFYTHSDDGSGLYIGNRLVVDNDTPHGPRTSSGQIALKKGWHPIRVKFFELGGGETLEVLWEGPGLNKQPLPKENLVH